MKKIIGFVLLFVSQVLAQPSDYWQQHVSYTISGTLIDSIHSFDGKLSVVYTNNSPDTLREVYFHLYYNAFQPGSMMHERAKELNDRGVADKIDHYKRSDWGEQRISEVRWTAADPEHDKFMSEHDAYTSRSSHLAKFEVTGTIMKVSLDYPLPPHQSIFFSMNFFVQIPPLTRRGGWMNDAGIKYSMSQWYPKICEYDREGWHHQEYVAREFYGVWGEFDVTMNVPSKFCIGSTGQCQNPEEAGWGYDQIAKGVKKGRVYPDSVLAAKHSALTTWHFKASNVHDFAWVAHEYIHEWDTWSDTITVHCLYKPTEEKYWSEAMPNTFAMLDHHSKKVGWYQYRNFTNTHGGDGGMEYPQLIMDGSPGAGLIMHEGGHQWFFGMIGNNETRYAFLDEGFTEFIEMTGMESYYGRYNERSPYRDTSWLTKMFIPEYDSRRNYYAPYLNIATDGYEEPLTIPHDWFREGVNAGQVYFKTLAGLAQLEYVLGDSMFWAGMKEYFRRWHFKHPNLNDFKRTMQDVSGADLDYYFDEWFGSTRTIDYEAESLKSEKQGDGYLTTVELKNKDLGVAPIDLTLHYEDGSTGIATIPLSVNQGAAYKKPEAGRLFFPSWDWVKKEYEGSIVTPKEVSWYEIDSSCRLMDINRRSNASHQSFLGIFSGRTSVGNVGFLKQYQNYPVLRGAYKVFRPIIWYDEVSKLNLGFGMLSGISRHSSYDLKLIAKLAPRRLNNDLGIEVSPEWYDYLDGELRSEWDTKIFGRLTKAYFDIRKFNGIAGINLSFEHEIRPEYLYLGPTWKIQFDLDIEGGIFRGLYPVFPSGWDAGFERSFGLRYSYISQNHRTNSQLFARMGNTLKVVNTFNGFTEGQMTVVNGFYQVGLDLKKVIPFSSEMELTLRGNLGLTSGELLSQYQYQLSGATNSEMLRADFFRSVASISRHFSDEARFFVEGGAGVRGYRGSKLSESISNNGNSLIGLNGDLKLPNPFSSLGSFASSFEFGLFGDAGWVGVLKIGDQEGESTSDILRHVKTDAGLSVKTNILSWLPWQLHGVVSEYGNIPKIGFYFPIYLNHPDDGKNNIAFRYVISLGTTF